jgi:DNA-binding CsgD family transcriptional regulator
VLRGRSDERERLDGLLDRARDGESCVLVVRGEPGIGKTALLQSAIERAPGFHVARAWGVQSEMELPFAGLHQLCAPMLGRLERLPAPQRDALGTAFGLSAGEAPDGLLVGLAVLGLLAEVAGEQPLVCLVDDIQWLDRASAQTLAFVARRLQTESIAMVFATRAPGDELTGLPEIVLEGLDESDSRAVLASAIASPLDEAVRDRIVAEARGNPLALLELPRGLTPAELAPGFRLPDAGALSTRIEESFRRRIEALPQESRHLSLVAAAEPVGDPVLVWRAAQRLGIGPDAAAPVATAGLAELGDEVGFRHPLVRSTIYGAASVEERRRVHRALAEATDARLDPDRRAWHRAQAATGLDEEVAVELERSAGRAQARGGLAAAAAFLERSAGLTPDPARRAQRALAAAQAKHQAGAPDAAAELLGVARAGPLDTLQRAQADLLSGQIAFAVRRGGDAAALLVGAARQLEPLDARLARETYLEALTAAVYAGRLTTGAGVMEVALAARDAARPSSEPRGPDLLLDGLALLITESYPAAAPLLKRAVGVFRSEEVSREEELRWLGLASHAALVLWDYDSWDVLSARLVALARDAGALAALPIAMNARVGVHLNAGELPAAASLIEEVEAITEATGSQMAPYGAISRATLLGREAEALALIEATSKEVVARGEGMALTFVQWTSAVLLNGLGRYDDALLTAQEASGHPEELWSTHWLHELVEAAVRSGAPGRAADALQSLSEMTRASGTDWALGIEARSRALVSDDRAAEELYREAIERLGRTPLRVALARGHLLYGEWLRRRRRRADAREHLRRAREMLLAMGVGAFAQRAERELMATGATARRRIVGDSIELTAQEAQIARLARDGLSNPEIGARLFISPRTVQHHLRTVFSKLEITSRNELQRVLG